MVHRYLSIAVALASILAIEGAEIKISGLRTPNLATEEQEADNGWDTAKMDLEKGIKCKAGSSKAKMGAGRECEGGFKTKVVLSMGAKELAEDVSTKIQDMHSGMMPDSKRLLPPDGVMDELMFWDEDMDEYERLPSFDGLDCSEDGEGCKKTVEFGGYVKINWGCTITFQKKGKKFTKEVSCGGKSFEGVGKKNLGNGDYETKKKNWTKQKQLGDYESQIEELDQAGKIGVSERVVSAPVKDSKII